MSKEKISLAACSHALLAVLFGLLLSACAVKKEDVSHSDLKSNPNFSDISAHDHVAWNVVNDPEGWIAYQKWIAEEFALKPWFHIVASEDGSVMRIFDKSEPRMILGRVYRPQVVPYLDGNGNKVDKAVRMQHMENALRTALAPLEGMPPEYIFYLSENDDRSDKDLFSTYASALLAVIPEWELFDDGRNKDVSEFLASPEANNPISVMTPGIYAAFHTAGASLMVDLFRDDEARFVLVTPPISERYRCWDSPILLIGIACRDLKESIDAETEQE
jgi:hypothetical protein